MSRTRWASLAAFVAAGAIAAGCGGTSQADHANQAAVALGWVALPNGTASAKPLDRVPSARDAIRDAESGHGYSHIRRAAAKLMTVGDVAHAFPDVDVPTWKLIGNDKIWVVAVSGVPRNTTNIIPEHYTWGVSVIDRRTGNEIALFAGSEGHWPPYFASLPNIARVR